MSWPAIDSLRYTAVLLLPAAVLCASRTAHADEGASAGWEFDPSVAFVTDYVDRGVSQSDGHGAMQGELLWQHTGGTYASVWASTVDFDDGGEAKAEVDFMLGTERELGAALLGWSVTYIHYAGAASSLHYDLLELSGSADFDTGPVTFYTQAIFSPQNAEHSGQALYAMTGVSRELVAALSVAAFAGRQWIEREDIAGSDYNAWGVELAWESERYSATLGFSDTDATDCGDICAARVSAAFSLSL
jgi:uncharacterized protein (TIGR02001 family)